MNRRRPKKSRFSGTGLIIGFASVMLVVLLTSYFFDQDNLDYEEPKFGIILDDSNYYSESEIAGWHTINTEKFKIQTPKEFKFFREKGIDSFIGGITDKNDTISFDYGYYSSSLNDLRTPNFDIIYKSINERDFKIMIGKNDIRYIGGFTDDLPDGNRLIIDCSGCADLEEKLRIIKTIDFRK
ncbi:hypothetical protein [Luteirhabdus pelagi]|uniref:hypothetical protein n=1 Tax=Luteirhabdus pelagi TaxID=2792783 RepID=UPI00193A4CEA|nr:hypothetical protein [Luteirhabdus pelagi]